VRASSGHASGSLHYSGLAYDVSGSPTLMDAYWRRAQSAFSGSINELFYDPEPYYIDEGQRVPGSIGGHSDHVHIGFFPGGAGGAAIAGIGGAIRAATPKALRVKAPGSKLRGAPGAMSNAGSRAMAAGMQAAVNKKLGAGGLAVRGASAGRVPAQFQRYNHSYQMHMAPDFSGETLPFNTVASIAEWAGLPGVTFAQIAKGESGMRPGSAGTDPGGTHGYGLWAITDGFNDELIARLGGVQAMLNPLINARAAKEIYSSQGIGAWYGTRYLTGSNIHFGGAGKGLATGGRAGFAGWFGDGGSFTANRPTLLGVGEKGRETVTVTKGGGGMGGVSIGQIHITNNRDGDIKNQLKREIHAAFGELAREMDGVGNHDGVV